MKTDPVPRFWAKVRQSNGCWVWTASNTTDGYGTFRIGDRFVRAHRYSWALEHGPIPRGLSVLHRCDNPSCVRPSHLFLGTQKDNMRDCVAKGRDTRVYGAKHHKTKLTAEMVHEMRVIRAQEGLSYARIAKRFGVWPGTAYNAINGKKLAQHLKDI